MNTTDKFPVLAILGPTASGKSSLANKVAQRFFCEIVNCDSRQIYKEMDIGTAKPGIAEQKLLKHHLYDIVSPDREFSAGNYEQLAKKTILEIKSRKKIALLTGGTGFYYNAISEGLPATGGDRNYCKELNDYLAANGLESLQSILQKKDPQAYESIDINNPRRIIRALEIIHITGRPFAENKPVIPLPDAVFLPIVVSRPRPALHERIAARVEKMLALGLQKEVEKLRKKFGSDAPGMRSIGYSEWEEFFNGQKTLAQVTEEIIIHSRQYAKRQETWFKKRPGRNIFNIEDKKQVEQTFALMENFLADFK
jgi:tRNA dimethylallyltransferase